MKQELKDQIEEAAYMLLGICDDWRLGDIAEFLQWGMDNPDELEDAGYPMQVCVPEHQQDILNQVAIFIRQ